MSTHRNCHTDNEQAAAYLQRLVTHAHTVVRDFDSELEPLIVELVISEALFAIAQDIRAGHEVEVMDIGRFALRNRYIGYIPSAELLELTKAAPDGLTNPSPCRPTGPLTATNQQEAQA